MKALTKILLICLPCLLLIGGLLGLEGIQRLRHPYAGFRNMTNSRGFRSPEFNLKKAPDTQRILFIGSSTTYGISGPVQNTFPYLTGQLLNQNKTVSLVETINASAPGRNSYWLPLRLREILPLDPDIIVVMIGENDCASIGQKFVDLSRSGDVKIRPWRERLIPWLAARSVLYITAREKWAIWRYGSPRFAFSPPPGKSQKPRIQPGWSRYYPRYFENNIAESIRIAKNHQIPIIFIQPPLSQMRRTQVPNYALAYDILMTRLKDVTTNAKVPLISTNDFYANLESSFSSGWDGIHLPQKAIEKMAQIVSGYLLEHRLLKINDSNTPEQSAEQMSD